MENGLTDLVLLRGVTSAGWLRLEVHLSSIRDMMTSIRANSIQIGIAIGWDGFKFIVT